MNNQWVDWTLRGLTALVFSQLLGCNKGSASDAPVASATPPVATSAIAATPPPAPAAPAAAASASAAPQGLTYNVFGVAANDVLNVRAEPSSASKKVYSFGPEVRGIVGTGQTLEKDKTPWMEVKFQDKTGWINRLFVTEHRAGNGCDDPALTAVIRAFMRGVAGKDATALQALVSPIRGLSLRQSRWNPTVHVALVDVPSLFTSPTPRKWGKEDSRDEEIVEPFKQHMLETLHLAVAGKGAQERCGKLIMGSSAGTNEWPPEYGGLTHVSFHHPGPELEPNHWVTWVLGMEYVDQKPYVAALIQYQWGA